MKNYYEIAPLKIIRAGSDVFTYESNEQLQAGQIVEIPVGKKNLFGVVWQKVNEPSFETKKILRVISNPIPQHLILLSKWMSEYYSTPLAHVLNGILPSGINSLSKTKISSIQKSKIISEHKDSCSNFLYNEEQTTAIRKIDKSPAGTTLLHGITGSGKTSIYIDQTKKALKNGKSAIILVPEISLTSQLVLNFEKYFSNIKILHSRQTAAKRRNTWNEILNNEEPQVIIGARSALFAPVKDLGLIVVDECHEPTFKQESTPKYSALRASSFLANKLNIKAIFGSATPLVEDYFLAELIERNGGNEIIKLSKLAKKEAKPPKIELIDLTKKDSKLHRFFSKKMINEINQTLSENKQILIYHNRRGTASVTLCHNCGWQALCPNCFMPLTLHADNFKLACHICGYKENPPTKCPICSEAEIIHKGIGTKAIESEIRKLYPNKRIERFDADSEKDKTVDQLYNEIAYGKIDIIIGTQVIAKGLDLPNLKTVCVVQADAGLALPDFTSSERNFQLISQVIGRVGRHSGDTNVIIQTYQPNAPSIQFGLKQDFEGFYMHEIEIRKKQNYPPFVYLLKLTCVYKTEASAIKNAQKEAQHIRTNYAKKVQIFGPTPAFYERVGETYRWQIIIKSKKRTELQKIASEFQNKAGWRVDLDPPTLI